MGTHSGFKVFQEVLIIHWMFLEILWFLKYELWTLTLALETSAYYNQSPVGQEMRLCRPSLLFAYAACVSVLP